MILNNCRLIPSVSNGVNTECGYVEISDGVIICVSDTPYCGEGELYDCKGKTLIPGLIDLHTHLTMLGGIGLDMNDPVKDFADALVRTGEYLEYGFTTIRDCGSTLGVANHVNNLVSKGVISGPNVISCGRTLMPSVVKTTDAGIARLCDGCEEFRYAVRQEVAYGSDFIKLYASGSAYNPSGIPMHPIMTAEEIRTAVETAKANGLKVAAHCHADGAIRTCIENGVYTIEHGTYIGDDTIELLSRTEDCFLVPTMGAMYVSQTDPVQRAFWLARLNPMLEKCASAVEKVYNAGLKMGFGTDSYPGSKQYDNGIEFQMRKELCHIDDEEIILQATKYSAEIAGLTDVGEIHEGYRADLVLVDGRPDKDISCMYGKPYAVWKTGKRVR